MSQSTCDLKSKEAESLRSKVDELQTEVRSFFLELDGMKKCQKNALQKETTEDVRTTACN